MGTGAGTGAEAVSVADYRDVSLSYLQDDLSYYEATYLAASEKDIFYRLKIINDPNINIAISAFGKITSHKSFYLRHGLLDLYIGHIHEVARTTRHYELKVAAVNELYDLGAFHVLYRLAKATAGRQDDENLKLRRIITNLFYETVNQSYDNTILGNIIRFVGLGTGGVRVRQTSMVDEAELINYLSALARITQDKTVVDKLLSLSRHKPLNRLVRSTLYEVYKTLPYGSELRTYLTEKYFKTHKWPV